MPWYALRSKRSKEESLWRQVGARGYEGYYPCVRVRHVNPRARKLRPYFPGYIFVRVNHPIVGMSLFSSVPDGLLDAIRLRVDEINVSGSGELHEQRKHASIFKEGDKVVISDGAFAGYQAIFDAHRSGTDRVCILLQLLQSRPMKLDLPAAQIELTNRR